MNRSLCTTHITTPISQTSVSQNSSLSALSHRSHTDKSATPSSGGRFERQHRKLFDQMKSIDETEKIRKERAATAINSSSERLMRLALPKERGSSLSRLSAEPGNSSTRPSTERGSFATCPSTKRGSSLSRQMSSGDASAHSRRSRPSSPTTTPTSSLPALRRTKALSPSSDAKVNVKALTKSASRISDCERPAANVHRVSATSFSSCFATPPVVSARLARLSTPKHRPPRSADESTKTSAPLEKAIIPGRVQRRTPLIDVTTRTMNAN